MKDVESYFAALPEQSRAPMERLRSIIRAAAPEATEVISYQMPAFKLGKVLVSYGAFKNHCSFFPMSTAVLEEFRDELKIDPANKGTLRFTADKPLPEEVVTRIVHARIAEVKK